MDLVLFYFWFLLLLFLILDLNKKYNVISYIIVTQATKYDICYIYPSHTHIII